MKDEVRRKKYRRNVPKDIIYSTGSLEMRKLLRKRPDVITKKVILDNIPVDDYAHFQAWCRKRGYTVTGKFRQLMIDCLEGRIE